MDKQKTPYKGSMDKRILKGKLIIGDLREKDLNAYLKSLPDAAENAREVVIELEARREAKGMKKISPISESDGECTPRRLCRAVNERMENRPSSLGIEDSPERAAEVFNPKAGVSSLFDSHCHLEMGEFAADREAVLQRALASGVRRIVTVGTTLEDSRKAVAIAERNPGVYASVGVHPHDVRGIDAGTYDSLKKLAASPKVVAFGEIGLDFFRNRSPREVQLARFREQLDIADDLHLPVIIHDREAHDETLAILYARQRNRGGIFHCFSGNREMADRCLELGFYVSIPGTVTFPKAETVREVVRSVPLSRLLIETDAPYLAPVPHRGKRNEPAFVVHTAARVAEIKGLPIEEVATATTSNALSVFGIREEEGR